ncbi:hypothetical protein LZ32DRAFT_367576 [Colletotrichum eremochloae]|nr:hypothetical protein LZ32DRAFT_367576 [Colletotrichum eremochloae]
MRHVNAFELLILRLSVRAIRYSRAQCCVQLLHQTSFLTGAHSTRQPIPMAGARGSAWSGLAWPGRGSTPWALHARPARARCASVLAACPPPPRYSPQQGVQPDPAPRTPRPRSHRCRRTAYTAYTACISPSNLYPHTPPPPPFPDPVPSLP